MIHLSFLCTVITRPIDPLHTSGVPSSSSPLSPLPHLTPLTNFLRASRLREEKRLTSEIYELPTNHRKKVIDRSPTFYEGLKRILYWPVSLVPPPFRVLFLLTSPPLIPLRALIREAQLPVLIYLPPYRTLESSPFFFFLLLRPL